MTKQEESKIRGEIGILLEARAYYVAERDKAYFSNRFVRSNFYQGYINAYEDEIKFLRELLGSEEK